VLSEVTLAHELTHALEDQRFGLDTERAETSGDAGLAYTAMVEGTATALMFEYLDRHFSRDAALGGLLASAFTGGDTAGIPPFILASLAFPYERGKQFVEELYRRAGGRWTLVDLALGSRAPVSTEQVMHAEKWLRVEVPETVRLPGIAAALGHGWRRLGAGSFGEFQTGLLLAQSGRARPEAAAGWGGDRYEVWRRVAPGAPCAFPCTDRDAVVLRWRWDSARDAAEFLPVLREAVAELPYARIAAAPREVTLALAPDAALAGQLALLGHGKAQGHAGQ
jgi:hypothetical protein